MPSSKNSELVSVIMPVLNLDHASLTRAIDSVMQQSYPNLELIICDDGSQKPVSRVLEAGGVSPQTHDFITVTTSEKTQGISQARNQAAAHARGKWLILLDGDDCLDEHCVANGLNGLSDQVHAVIGSCRVTENGRSEMRLPHLLAEQALNCARTADDPFLSTITSLQPFLMRKSTFDALGGFSAAFEYAEVTELFLRFLYEVGIEQVAFRPNAIYHYFRGRQGSHSSERSRLLHFREMALENYRNACGLAGSMVYQERDSVTGFQKYALQSGFA